jgi:Flp pilus assembly protein TadG
MSATSHPTTLNTTGRHAAGPEPGRGTRVRHDGGQSLVEFSLILPVFVLLLFGLIDVGRFTYLNSVLSQGAREGSRLAAVEASWIGSTDLGCNAAGGPVCPNAADALAAHARTAANRMIVPFGTVDSLYIRCDTPGNAPTGAWTGVSCTSHTTGDIVSVRVVLRFTPLTPIIGQIIGSITTTGSATMVVN